jgi:energy-coupling factor transporter ATP-binding protein EcfA2
MEELENINVTNVNNLNFKIPHRNWKQSFAEAFVYMTTAMPGEVISIYGPSRAGKSSLLIELSQAICGKTKPDDDEQPLAMIEIDNNGGKAAFSFKAFLKEMLEIMRHPIYSSCNYDGWYDPNKPSRVNRVTEDTLAKALVEAFRQRKTLFWVVDEAQHIKYAGKDVSAQAGVMDSLKTLAKKAGVILVICGTYPILQIINRSGHLENRKHDVHLSRYRNTEEDLEEFLWILANYDAVLDLDPSLGSLQTCAELLYNASFGCIGSIRACLYRASVQAALDGQKIGIIHIQRGLKAAKLLATSAQEIRDGESFLGIEPCTSLQHAVRGEMIPCTNIKQKKAAKPFQRKPKRYAPGNRV